MKTSKEKLLRDRLLLSSIIIFIWLSTKVLELIIPDRVIDILPGPLPTAILFVGISLLFIYLVILYLAQRRKLRRQRFSQNIDGEALSKIDYPSVDVFIAAHNEAKVIKDTLLSVLELDYPDFKVWIIDDRSSDGTAKQIEDFLDERPDLKEKVIVLKRKDGQVPGKPASLNEALSKSAGEYILVCDADARIMSKCIKLAMPYFYNDAEVGAVQFQKKISNANYNLLTVCQDLEMAFDTYLQNGRDALNGFVELRGNGQLASRKCLLDVEGWQEDALTEDLEISTKMNLKGWRVRFAPEIAVYEEGVTTPKALLKQRKRWIEGSLRRYLDHFQSFISPKTKLSFAKRLDVLPFLAEFAIPVWVFLDLIVQCVYWVLGRPTHIPMLTLAAILTSLLIWVNVLIAIGHWRKEYSFFNLLRYGTLAFFYGAFHLPLLVLWSTRKVIFSRSQGEWVKTPRMADGQA